MRNLAANSENWKALGSPAGFLGHHETLIKFWENVPMGNAMAENLLGEAVPAQAETDEFSRLELLAKWFRGLDDPVRLGILTVLRRGEKSVEELCEILGMKQPRISNHLACLRWCGFVASRRQGQRIFYRIADPNVEKILDLAQDSLARNAEWVLTCTRA